ncbi:ent-kaurene synthase protein [Rutstroemia sp. NJR-2017a BVV2]|nr:ent-kaurene synthase protein [Rutstroemia sp. NJR-2017a BVV2]
MHPTKQKDVSNMSIQPLVFSLLEELALKCGLKSGFGNMSIAVYDTAWLAMIQKETESEKKWLFSECYRYLLESQSSDGGWPSYSSEVDGIINTMSALLALKRHAAYDSSQNRLYNEDIQLRISQATAFLSSKLQTWNVEDTVHVGFEILVPALLDFLEQESDPVHFEFPGRELLMQMNMKKLKRFEPTMLYGKTQTTLLHSLEAFVGKIDFDRVVHHRVSGSMMGSPSATAAYLMNASTWDEEAEAYLRTTIQLGAGKGSGGAPSAFPSTIFEVTWRKSLSMVKDAWDSSLVNLDTQRKTATHIYIAPFLQPDADDTAKGILCLNLLKRPTRPDRMIPKFSTGDHFKTFFTEQSPSFSANCNVLNMLIHLPNPDEYVQPILEAANFVAKCWTEGNVKDKWNLSQYYSMMLMAEALMGLWQLWGSNRLPGIPAESPIIEQLPLIIFQVLSQTLNSQKENGAWGGKNSPEETAYGVLTLKAISVRPWPAMLATHIKTAIDAGRKFLLSQRQNWINTQYLWVEKVTYGSQIITLSYCLAALNPCEPKSQWGQAMHSQFTASNKAVSKFSDFYSRIPLFANEPAWKIEASLVESYLTLPKLRRLRHEIFPRTDMGEDKYLEYIPFTWIGINNLSSQKDGLAKDIVWEMMVISMLNYQVDEYMEAVVGRYFTSDLDSVRCLIRRLCRESDSTTEPALLKTPIHPTNGAANGVSHQKDIDIAPGLADVEKVLSRFINYILQHAAVTSSSPYAQKLVRYDLEKFLLAHVTQEADNSLFAREISSTANTTVWKDAPTSYYHWIHNTSADHTSCPYSFALFSCLVARSVDRQDLLQGARQKYLAQDVCQHLANLCRQYNDYGSIVRDRQERNLNSVNFPEFSEPAGSGKAANGHTNGHQNGDLEPEGNRESWMKKELFWIANYERQCLDLAVKQLEDHIDEVSRNALRVFVRVTDLYGQIYVARDIATSVRTT